MQTMETTLFLLCPTDCLESKIKQEFKGDNLFYSIFPQNVIDNYWTIRLHIEKNSNHEKKQNLS